MKIPTIHNWEISNLFDEIVITGKLVDGTKIVAKLIWISAWVVGTDKGKFKLGVEQSDDWSWVRDVFSIEDCRNNPLR